MNLLSAAERLAALDGSRVDLQTELCLHSMGKFSTCQACHSICPAGAIQPGKPPSLDVDKCQNCLACLPVCPTGAFKADDAVPGLLNCAARIDTYSIELLCEYNPLPEKGLNESCAAIRLKGCLAGIGVGGCFALFALGVQEVIFRDEVCTHCPQSALRFQIDRQIESACRLLSAWGLEGALRACGPIDPQPFVERPFWEASNPPLSRRDLFRLATRQGQITAARVLSADHSVTGKHPSRDRQRLLAAITHLAGSFVGDQSLSLDGLGFAILAISEECTACGVCARACPTGALQFLTQEDMHFQLNFDPRMCIDCGNCMVVCGENAIERQTSLTFDQVFGGQEPLTLISGDLGRCEQCHTLYAARPGSRLCSPCAFRRKNPFGSRLPAGCTGRQ